MQNIHNEKDRGHRETWLERHRPCTQNDERNRKSSIKLQEQKYEIHYDGRKKHRN